MGAQHGESNGLSMILNAEKFDNAPFDADGSGFKVAIHDHRDMPIMEHLGTYIPTGMVTQLAVFPSITYTSQDALDGLEPSKRNCYREFEANLTFFPHEYGFRYGMDNCLVNEVLVDVIWECR